MAELNSVTRLEVGKLLSLEKERSFPLEALSFPKKLCRGTVENGIKVFGRKGGEGEGEPFFKKVSFPLEKPLPEVSSYIKFLGTAGARVVVTKQLRASGGIWLCLEGKNILLDPGPGCLVRALQSKPKLDPTALKAIVLSHRHLDHAGDVNIMIEAMTEGGFKKRGMLLAPQDALEGPDPVVFRYLRGFVERIETLKEGGSYEVDGVQIRAPKRHLHGVETYGLNFSFGNSCISYVADTRFFPELLEVYPGQVLIMNVVRLKHTEGLDHLSMEDVPKIVQALKPRVTILTHFGMTVVKAKPWEVAEKIAQETGQRVIAARDGMSLDLGEVL